MKRAALVSGVTGALIIGATGAAFAAEPAGPAPASSSPTGMSQAVEADGPITTQGYGDCVNQLVNWGYAPTPKRRTICLVAATSPWGHRKVIAGCSASLVLTGVGAIVAGIACTAAVLV